MHTHQNNLTGVQQRLVRLIRTEFKNDMRRIELVLDMYHGLDEDDRAGFLTDAFAWWLLPETGAKNEEPMAISEAEYTAAAEGLNEMNDSSELEFCKPFHDNGNSAFDIMQNIAEQLETVGQKLGRPGQACLLLGLLDNPEHVPYVDAVEEHIFGKDDAVAKLAEYPDLFAALSWAENRMKSDPNIPVIANTLAEALRDIDEDEEELFTMAVAYVIGVMGGPRVSIVGGGELGKLFATALGADDSEAAQVWHMTVRHGGGRQRVTTKRKLPAHVVGLSSALHDSANFHRSIMVAYAIVRAAELRRQKPAA